MKVKKGTAGAPIKMTPVERNGVRLSCLAEGSSATQALADILDKKLSRKQGAQTLTRLAGIAEAFEPLADKYFADDVAFEGKLTKMVFKFERGMKIWQIVRADNSVACSSTFSAHGEHAELAAELLMWGYMAGLGDEVL